MPGRVYGAGDRIRDLEQARRGGARPPQPSITPADVLGMIDRVIAGYGLDPRKLTEAQGWRRLSWVQRSAAPAPYLGRRRNASWSCSHPSCDSRPGAGSSGGCIASCSS